MNAHPDAMQPALPRSYLFVPGNRPERFDKASASGADAVIVDLEDAVPPDQKGTARAAVAGWLSADRPVVLRINAAGTPWFDADLALCRDHANGIAGIMLSKAERVDDLARLEGLAPLLPLIESALGFDNLRAICGTPGVQRLCFGSIDFQLDLGIPGEGEALLYFRSQLVLMSRLAGLAAPVDGVTANVSDVELARGDALRARQLGFGAKLCIHPRQVEPVNAAFGPSAGELAWARRVIVAGRDAAGAAVSLDGVMVDRPVMLQAQALLQRAGEIS